MTVPGCTVCLSFDIDAYSPMLFEGEQSPAALSRGEFSANVGVPRLLALLAEFEIRATFFIPGHTARWFPAAVPAVLAGGHEIGHHGYLHEPPARLSPAEEEDALALGIQEIERQAGLRPTGYRAPLWQPSMHTIGLLEREGFEFDSSLMGDDFTPYWAPADEVITAELVSRGRQTSVVEMPSSWVFDDWSYFANVRRAGGTGPTPPAGVFEIWTETVRFAAESVAGAVLVVTMHPEVSGQGYVIRFLRRWIEWLQGQDGVSLQAVGAAASAWRAREGRRPAGTAAAPGPPG